MHSLHGALHSEYTGEWVGGQWAGWEGGGRLQLPLALERVVGGHEVEAVRPVGVEDLGLVPVPG